MIAIAGVAVAEIATAECVAVPLRLIFRVGLVASRAQAVHGFDISGREPHQSRLRRRNDGTFDDHVTVAFPA